MRLESLVEIARTPHGVGNGYDEAYQSDDSKQCKSSPCWKIVRNTPWVRCVVHAHQLEDEVRHGGKVEYDDDAHPCKRLAAREECSQKEYTNRDRNSDDGQVKLDVGRVANDDQELDRETEKEEEIKFEQ